MKALNVLVWNIDKNTDVGQLVNYYCMQYLVDVLVLIEDNIPPSTLLGQLNHTYSKKKYHFCRQNDRKISIYTSFDSRFFDTKHTATKSNFINFVEFKLGAKSILFGGIHLSSKQTLPAEYDRASLGREITDVVKGLENKLGHCNTIIAGDFNMNPFELGMCQHDAFNAVMSQEIALTKERKVTGSGTNTHSLHPYFYNPMWSFMGDLSKYPPGTHYWYDNSRQNNFRWNTYDQILLRPCLIPNFVSTSLEIIETDNTGKKLIDTATKTRSNKQLFDHLPIFLTLDLSK